MTTNTTAKNVTLNATLYNGKCISCLTSFQVSYFCQSKNKTRQICSLNQTSILKNCSNSTTGDKILTNKDYLTCPSPPVCAVSSSIPTNNLTNQIFIDSNAQRNKTYTVAPQTVCTVLIANTISNTPMYTNQTAIASFNFRQTSNTPITYR